MGMSAAGGSLQVVVATRQCGSAGRGGVCIDDAKAFAAPSQKVVLAILKEAAGSPVEKVIKLALKRL